MTKMKLVLTMSSFLLTSLMDALLSRVSFVSRDLSPSRKLFIWLLSSWKCWAMTSLCSLKSRFLSSLSLEFWDILALRDAMLSCKQKKECLYYICIFILSFAIPLYYLNRGGLLTPSNDGTYNDPKLQIFMRALYPDLNSWEFIEEKQRITKRKTKFGLHLISLLKLYANLWILTTTITKNTTTPTT